MEQRIQSFLTIMDTFHDFTATRMTSVDKNIRTELQKQIYQIIQPYFTNCLQVELNIVQNNVKKNLYDKFLKIFKKIYESETITFINNVEDKTVEIITKIKPEPCFIKLKKQLINAEILYSLCKTNYNTNKIIYILDKTSFIEPKFCINRIDSIIIQTNTTIHQHNNTIFKGLFNVYENMQFKVGKELGGLHKFIVNANILTPPVNQEDICIQLGDYYEYKLTKGENELLFVEEFGVKQNLSNKIYYLYRKINANEFKINFKNIEESTNKGVPLFASCIKDVYELDYVRTNALEIISKIFGIRINRHYHTRNSNNSNIILNNDDYVYALLDFKRSMDYLQVKACIEGNRIYKDAATYIFVSNDRLAIQYALLNNCPCMRTSGDDGYLYIPTEVQVGGILTQQLPEEPIFTKQLQKEPILKNLGNPKLSPISDTEINIDDIIPKNELFGKFLIKYKELFEDKISVFWYVVYFMIYNLLTIKNI